MKMMNAKSDPLNMQYHQVKVETIGQYLKRIFINGRELFGVDKVSVDYTEEKGETETITLTLSLAELDWISFNLNEEQVLHANILNKTKVEAIKENEENKKTKKINKFTFIDLEG